jgi:hypothetical protein
MHSQEREFKYVLYLSGSWGKALSKYRYNVRQMETIYN